MHFDIHLIFIITFLGLFTGYIDGIAGGGGLLTVPVLLGLGLSPLMTLGTSKFAGVLGCSQSLLVFVKKNIVSIKFWYPVIFGAILGAALGAVLIQLISSSYLTMLIPLLMLVIIIYMLIPKPTAIYQRKIELKPKKRSSIPIASCIGFYDGFFGPGTAALGTSLMMLIYKVDLVQATGLVRLVLLASNISALAMFLFKGNVNFAVGLTLGSTYMIGSYLGAVSAIHFGSRFIKPIFLFMSAIICLYLLLHKS